MNETQSRETLDIKNPSADNYKNILPETKQTVNDANTFWDKELGKSYDDNGNEYRDGDKLVPNNEYEVNGYKYKTDEEGRIVSAEGELRIEPPHERDMEVVRNKDGQEYKETDDRGHLIAHQFGGSDKLENLVPMDSELNKGDFKALENTLADAVKDGAEVYLKVEPVFEGDSSRPTEFKVSYTIDGEKEVTVFKNGGKSDE